MEPRHDLDGLYEACKADHKRFHGTAIAPCSARRLMEIITRLKAAESTDTDALLRRVHKCAGENISLQSSHSAHEVRIMFWSSGHKLIQLHAPTFDAALQAVLDYEDAADARESEEAPGA